MSFSKIEADVERLKLLIKTEIENKELFTLQVNKATKEITLLEGMIEEMYQGTVDSRCKWIWENGSIAGYTYEPSEKDKEDIDKIKHKIASEEEMRAQLSNAIRDCKKKSIELQNHLAYAYLDVNIKQVRTSTHDDVNNKKKYGSIFYVFEIDVNEYDNRGMMTHSSSTIKYTPDLQYENGEPLEWCLMRTMDNKELKEIPIDKDPKWTYIINKFLKPKVNSK